MARLTYKSHCAGDYGGAKDFETLQEEIWALRNALGPFEDLGKTPEELKEIIDKYEKEATDNGKEKEM